MVVNTSNDPRTAEGKRILGRIFTKPRIGTGGSVDRRSPAVAILGDGGSLSKIYPGYRERRQQLDLTAFVANALQAREHAVAEAATGVGKSFGYLIPLILTRRPSLVAVPTNALLTQLMTKDLPALSAPGVMPHPFTYAELKGRANYLCLYKSERFKAEPSFQAAEDVKAWPSISDWMQDTTDGDLGKLSIPLPMAIRQEITATSDECLGESCPAYDRCYAETAKATAQNADIIVTNLTMMMLDLDLRYSSGGLASIIPDREYVVIDEGHRARDVAAGAATTEINLSGFTRIAQQIVSLARSADKAAVKDYHLKVAQTVAANEPISYGAETVMSFPRQDAIETEWSDRLQNPTSLLTSLFMSMGDRLIEAGKSAQRLGNELDVSQDALVSLHGLLTAVAEMAPSQLDATERKAWEKLTARLGTWYDGLCNCLFPSPIRPMSERNTVRFVSVNDKGRVTFAYAPIDVAPWLRERLWTASLVKPAENPDGSLDASVCVPVTVVVVSATIVDNGGALDYFRETVGLDRCRQIVVGSPFNFRDNSVLYVPSDERFDSSAARKDRKLWAEYLDLLTDEYERLIHISRGRAFCLFTSNATLDYVYSRLMARNLPFTLLRQGELPQPELIRQFKDDGNAVLFGVKSYWEGVDVQGPALSITIISGTPFTPPDDPIYAARCELADRRYGSRASFQKISIPEATRALQQAAGRTIRSVTDQGAICILDSRLRYKKYGAGILAALPASPVVGSTNDVAAFFERIG